MKKFFKYSIAIIFVFFVYNMFKTKSSEVEQTSQEKTERTVNKTHYQVKESDYTNTEMDLLILKNEREMAAKDRVAFENEINEFYEVLQVLIATDMQKQGNQFYTYEVTMDMPVVDELNSKEYLYSLMVRGHINLGEKKVFFKSDIKSGKIQYDTQPWALRPYNRTDTFETIN